MLIRTAQIKDADTMARLHHSCFSSSWDENSFSNFLSKCDVYQSFIAENAQHQAVGFITVSQIGEESEILTLCVLPDHRQKGIAKALLNHTVKILKNLKVVSLHLEVSSKNATALAFYHSFGFCRKGVRQRYSKEKDGSYADALMMTYQIKRGC